MDGNRKEPASPVVFAVAGVLVGGAAAFALRGRLMGLSLHRSSHETEKAVRQAVETALQGLRQDVQLSVSSAESRLGSKLQTQERAIGDRMSGHYKDLNSRLDTVNAARTELSGMARKMDDLQTIFVSPRRRGAFGELQLEAIIRDVMHPGSYEFQATLSNGKRPDCLLRLPHPIGSLAIDSKFPMDSYIELSKIPSVEVNGATEIRKDNSRSDVARKKLAENLRKHIRDIASKYIIPGETADCALLFLPSEAIFAEIVEHHTNIVTEAHQSRVWIACPTTLMAVLTTMRGVVRGMAVSERADAIVSEVGAIIKDVDRLVQRSENVEKGIEKARENLRLMRVSIDKIQRRKGKLDVLNEREDEVLVSQPPAVEAEDEPAKSRYDEEQVERQTA